MANWIQIKGLVTKGYGVASGQGQDPRFPNGTLAMQIPFFQKLGLDLSCYFSGTINVSIAPRIYQIKQAKYTLRNVQWSAETTEDFSFCDSQILLEQGESYAGFIYYPHPETKPEHFQTPDTLEIITFFIDGLNYGDQVIIAVDSEQIQLD